MVSPGSGNQEHIRQAVGFIESVGISDKSQRWLSKVIGEVEEKVNLRSIQCQLVSQHQGICRQVRDTCMKGILARAQQNSERRGTLVQQYLLNICVLPN